MGLLPTALAVRHRSHFRSTGECRTLPTDAVLAGQSASRRRWRCRGVPSCTSRGRRLRAHHVPTGWLSVGRRLTIQIPLSRSATRVAESSLSQDNDGSIWPRPGACRGMVGVYANPGALMAATKVELSEQIRRDSWDGACWCARWRPSTGYPSPCLQEIARPTLAKSISSAVSCPDGSYGRQNREAIAAREMGAAARLRAMERAYHMAIEHAPPKSYDPAAAIRRPETAADRELGLG